MIIILLHDINSLLIDFKIETEAKNQHSNRNKAHQNTSGISFPATLTIDGKFSLLLTADGKS